jgi:hypothetical protein
LERLEAVGEVLDVGPGPVGLGALDLLGDEGVVGEVGVVQVTVVPQQEGGEVQGEVRVLLVRS